MSKQHNSLHNSRQLGVGLIEVLWAIFLFALVAIMLVNYQQLLLERVLLENHRQHAYRLAFQQLDIYPDTLVNALPVGWQQAVFTASNNGKLLSYSAQYLANIRREGDAYTVVLSVVFAFFVSNTR